MIIPTFEVGQRVRIHNRPVEFCCPKCGKRMFEDHTKPEYLGTIRRVHTGYECPRCGHTEISDGWHSISVDGLSGIWALPYTLIEAIKEEQE